MRVGHDLVGRYVAAEAPAVDTLQVAAAAAALVIGPPGEVLIVGQRAGDEALDFDTDDELPLAPGEDDTGASADLVRAYLKQMGKEPLLDAEQEVELSKQIEAGLFAEELLRQWGANGQPPLPGITEDELHVIQAQGEAAVDRFLRANLRLVVSIARRYNRRGMDFLDIIQEGNTGLIRAVQKFDYQKGYKFSTYATWWIRQSISRAMAYQARTIRLPSYMFELVTKLGRIEHELYQALGREPTAKELAWEMDIAPEQVKEIQGYARKPIPLNALTGPDDATELGDLVEDADVPEPTEGLVYAAMRDELKKVLGTLTSREREIVRMRFGLDDGKPRSLAEVAKAFKLTRERIRQIQSIVIKKLRDPSRSETLRGYW